MAEGPVSVVGVSVGPPLTIVTARVNMATANGIVPGGRAGAAGSHAVLQRADRLPLADP